jgi:two-component system, OmpR family, alkaline phosphatase synthesis response regulator PhoP
MTSSRILLVEDEPGLLITLTDLLTGEGYDVETATDGNTGLAKALSHTYMLVILDVMLPGRSGMEVCREIRNSGRDLAILMLTARSQSQDKVQGLKLGADDYVTKPFEPAELLARVEALLRRMRPLVTPHGRFTFGDVDADFTTGVVTRGGEKVTLAAKEMQLLQYLIENKERVIPREELLQRVWGYQPLASSRTVDVHLAWLRQKLEPNTQVPQVFSYRARCRVPLHALTVCSVFSRNAASALRVFRA